MVVVVVVSGWQIVQMFQVSFHPSRQFAAWLKNPTWTRHF